MGTWYKTGTQIHSEGGARGTHTHTHTTPAQSCGGPAPNTPPPKGAVGRWDPPIEWGQAQGPPMGMGETP